VSDQEEMVTIPRSTLLLLLEKVAGSQPEPEPLDEYTIDNIEDDMYGSGRYAV